MDDAPAPDSRVREKTTMSTCRLGIVPSVERRGIIRFETGNYTHARWEGERTITDDVEAWDPFAFIEGTVDI